MVYGGYIKVHRKWVEWEWHKNPEMVSFWWHLVSVAQHETQFVEGIKVERGQILTSRDSLVHLTGLSERKVRTCINRLKTSKQITIKSTNKYSIITICKYDVYQIGNGKNDQQDDQQDDQQTSNKRPTNVQQTSRYNNIKNEKNEKNISDDARVYTRTRRGFRIPVTEREMLTIDHLVGLLTDDEFNREQLEAIAMKFRIGSIQRTAEIVDKEFRSTMLAKGMTGNTLKDGRAHLFNWFCESANRINGNQKVSTIHFDGEKNVKLKIS